MGSSRKSLHCLYILLLLHTCVVMKGTFDKLLIIYTYNIIQINVSNSKLYTCSYTIQVNIISIMS